MKELILDGKQIHSKAALHEAVKAQLDLPDWYGANLDALYDVLTERHQLQITVRNQGSLRKYLQEDYDPVMATILDAVEDNASLLLVVESERQPEQKLWAKKLTEEEMVAVYQNHMMQDFPPEERKPLDTLRKAMTEGIYDCFGWFDEQGNMMVYSFFVRVPENNVVVLDYLAVCADFRGQRNGSRVLAEMPKLYPDCAGIVAEVEDPAESRDEEEQNVRDSRVRFYKKNGMKRSTLKTIQYGVPYIVLVLPIEDGKPAEDYRISEELLMEEMDRVYHLMFSPEILEKYICLWKE